MKDKLLLIGGGGHCKSCIDVIEQEGCFEIGGILDKKEHVGRTVLGYEIIGSDEDFELLRKQFGYALITLGQIKSAAIRNNLYRQLKTHGYVFPVVISPRAYVSKYASIGAGTIVMHDVLVNAGASIGKNCIINSKALVEHDVIVEDFCHISTAAVLNGGTVVKRGSFFGSNAVSKEYTETEPNDFIKAGSVFK